MKTSTTSTRTTLLNALENQVEKHLKEAISLFQNMRDVDLLRPSASGGWSIAQCLDHLNSYGHFYYPKIKKGLDASSQNQSAESFKSTWLGNYFTRIMDPETGKKKFKAFKNHRPETNLDPYTVIATFIDQQESLLEYLKAARNADLNKIKVPLSINRFITFKLGDAFRFLVAHNERHILQAKRNIG